MPGAGEAIGRAALWVRREAALVYGAWRERLRSMDGTAWIRHSWKQKKHVDMFSSFISGIISSLCEVQLKRTASEPASKHWLSRKVHL